MLRNAKCFLLLLVSVLCSILSWAQGARMITGKITDENNQAVAGAAIQIKGTAIGTIADSQGNFTLTAKNGDVLVVSATNFGTLEVKVGTANIVNASITRQSNVIDEVVVTALGIRRKPKEVGYSSQTIRGEAVTAANNPNLANALSGKISGLVIFNVNSSIQADTRVVLRGNRSITGNNQALIVLDGVPVPQNTLTYLNPNDVENVTVLKGGQAATLYGSDGVNGVIMVTTKKGSKGRSQVTFTSSAGLEQVSFLPKFQNRFGSGSGYGFDPRDNYRTFENQSYGDEYDGSVRPIGRVTSDKDSLMLPYSARPDEKKKVWDNGSVIQNDIAVSGGDDRGSFYLSAQDVMTRGVVPGDEKRRDAFRFNATRNFGNKFKAGFQASYTQDRFDRTNSDFYFLVINAAAHIPLNDLRDWRTNKFASPNGYYNDYYNNPWFELENNRWRGRNSYFNGSMDLNYQPFSWLNATYRLGTATTNTIEKITTGQFIYSAWAKSSAYVPAGFSNDYNGIFRAKDILGGVTDRFSTGGKDGDRINSDLILTFKKDWNRISTTFIAGNNIQQRSAESVNLISNSIVIPDLYNVSNRTGELGGGQGSAKQRRYGFYGDLTVGLNDLVFVHGSFRRDGTSLFYKDGRDRSLFTYNYYGVDASVILTDAISALKGKVLNYAKLRAGFNRNGNDNINPYSLDLTYGVGGGFPYGALAGTTVGNSFPDSALAPEFINSYEAGLELGFFNNRVTMDLSYYYQKSTNQSINVSLAPSTGFSGALLNAGRVDNWGYEAEIKSQIVRGRNWQWDVNVNYGFSDNKVKSLFGTLKQVGLGTQFTESGGVVTAQTFAVLDNPFPLIKVTDFKRDDQGRIIVDKSTGYPSLASDQMIAGNSNPKHMLGLTTSVKYKNLALTATAEYRGGNVIFHGLGSSMTFTGVAYVTAQYGRENFIIPNSAYDDGTGKYVANTTVPVADGHYYFWDQLFKFAGRNYITSGAFWKLREVNLTYTFSQRLLSKVKVFKSASFSLVGRNLLALIPKDNYYTDPEFSNTTNNGIGINNTLQTPPVRSYGATLSLVF